MRGQGSQPASMGAMEEVATLTLGSVGSVGVAATRVDASIATATTEQVAVELPVALVYNGISHAVMLATPLDLEDFAMGFSLTEGIIAHPRDVLDVELVQASKGKGKGIEVQLTVTQSCLAQLKERRRNLLGRTGCGLCGVDSLEQAVRPISQMLVPLDVELDVLAHTISTAMGRLNKGQPLQQATGAVHSAAFAGIDGQIVLQREDVGRHNALDKLIGALAKAKMDTSQGIVLVSSRASYEMVHKAASAGIPVLAAVSAPTQLAIDTARSAGLTLVGFVREQRATFYTHF